jgi:hypothetical protein
MIEAGWTEAYMWHGPGPGPDPEVIESYRLTLALNVQESTIMALCMDTSITGYLCFLLLNLTRLIHCPPQVLAPFPASSSRFGY